MIAVVAGHVLKDDAAHHVLYAFHMPLFFMLSGFVFRTPNSLPDLAKKRLYSLAILYVAFLTLVSMLDIALGSVDGLNWLTPTLHSVAFLIFGGSVLRGALTVFWFVPCLFVTNLLYAAIARRFGPPSSRGTVALVFAFYVLACGLSWVHHHTGQPRETPLGLGQAPLAVTFFWVGALKADWRPGLRVLLPALLAFVICLPISPAIDMKALDFGIPLRSAAVAILSSSGLIGVAMLLTKVPVASRIAEEIGRSSLVIMFLHMLIFMHLAPYLSGASTVAVCVAVSYVAYRALLLSPTTRTLFLGMGPQQAAMAPRMLARRRA